MDYKLVAIDMDGTLLGDNGISDVTRETLNEVHNKGVEIAIATGRILPSALYHYRSLGIEGNLISCNGAIIANTKSGEIIYSRPLKKEKIVEIMNLAEEYDMYYHFYSEDTFYSRKNKRNVSNDFYNYQGNFKREGVRMISLENPLSELDLDVVNIYKFLFIEDDEIILTEFREKLEELDRVYIASSWHDNVEVMDIDVSKGKTLEILCEKKNINIEEVVSFGDNENDLDMIKKTGLGVAMENAVDILKEEADLVTKSNNEDGVALILNKYILN